MSSKAADRAIAKLSAQARARRHPSEVLREDWCAKSREKWNAKCLKSFLTLKPWSKDVDPDIHCQVLLMTANAAKGAGISAGHVGRLASRLYDQIEALVVKARKYDQMVKEAGGESDAE